MPFNVKYSLLQLWKDIICFEELYEKNVRSSSQFSKKMHFDLSLILSAFLYRALSYVELKVFYEIKYDFLYHLILIFIFRNNIFYYFWRTEFFPLLKYGFIIDFNFHFAGMVSQLQRYYLIIFCSSQSLIKFIIIRKIPLRLRNDSRILKIKIDGEEELSYGNL